MTIKPLASTEEASISTGISRSRLMAMKASGELTAGKHWVYFSGKKNSPIGWDVSKIRDWQIEQAKFVSEANEKAAAEIEEFADLGV